MKVVEIKFFVEDDKAEETLQFLVKTINDSTVCGIADWSRRRKIELNVEITGPRDAN